ncbi:MAG: addiction module antidote protein, HigA family [Actinobacteria bacterium]|nr:addiction module antidote protein, HigA family [Actinomycetota bacterium]
MSKSLEPVSPGELLLEEFMIPMGLTSYRLAKECEVPAQRIGEILKGRRSITADTDLRLCRFSRNCWHSSHLSKGIIPRGRRWVY